MQQLPFSFIFVLFTDNEIAFCYYNKSIDLQIRPKTAYGIHRKSQKQEGSIMIAIERLKERIESWKEDFEKLKEENEKLKEENETLKSGSAEGGASAEELAKKDETIGRLRDELEQKDIEIEAIISKVEALLD